MGNGQFARQARWAVGADEKTAHCLYRYSSN